MITTEELIALVGESITLDEVESRLGESEPIDLSILDLGADLLQQYHFCNGAAGYELIHRNGRIETVFLKVQSKKACNPYSGEIPGGLPRSALRADVQSRWGVPTHVGPAWDRFDLEKLCLHFQYSEKDQRIEQVTIMSADSAPSLMDAKIT